MLQREQRILDGFEAGWFRLGELDGWEAGPRGAVLSEVTGSKFVLPQRPQNFAPAAKRDPHFVQATTA